MELPSPATIFFFLPLLGVWNFGGVRSIGSLECARLEFSGCRVKNGVWETMSAEEKGGREQHHARDQEG